MSVHGAQVLVSRRALERVDPPGFVYRQAPVSATDSGWAVLVGDEAPDELDDPRAAVSLDRDALVARWPALGPVFATEAADGEWTWDAEAGRYAPLER